jgi:alkaline phosphatase D
MGDNVYGDVSSAEMTELREAYAALAAQPGFQRVRARVPILPIWDDHDYGANDAGGDFPYRQESAALFRAFWQVPADSPRGRRDGLYDAWTFGPPGRRLQVILLDLRWFRSPLRPTDERGAPGKERYLPDADPSKTMLGEAQWAWLAERLREPADLRLLVSSIQVLAEGHGWERWGNLPLERERLIRLIGEAGAGGVVLLSGDRHLGALYERTRDVPYPLHEITSSSFNRPFRDAREQDPLQQGDIYTGPNFGIVRIDWPAGRPRRARAAR